MSTARSLLPIPSVDRRQVAGVTTVDHSRVAAALEAATSKNTRRVYYSGWERWHRWAADRGAQLMPADPAAVAAYLAERAEQVSPAAVRLDRASIAAAHRACGEADPCVHEGVRQVMRGISRTGRGQGRGQVAGLDWRAADLAAGIAANEGHSLAGLRDAALITVGSDALLRVSEIAALTVADVQVQSDGSGTVTIHASKTDQEGRGHTRYLGAPTVAAVQRWMQASGISAGPLFVRVRRGDVAGTKPLDVRSIRSIIAKRAAAAGIPDRISGHSLRVGSAQSLAAAGAGLVELQQAGDWKAPQMPARYARHQFAARGAVAKLRYQAGQ